jgi:4-amino-4-deoxy-L-arabinose transferase-like glycosyltransferase
VTPPIETPGTIFFPESHSSERRITLLIFILTAAYLLLFRRYTMMDPDEGIVLQGALRILRGEVIYRDFFSFFTPGSYYLLAALFKVFGNSFITARTALAVFGGLFSVVTYLLARRVCFRSTSLWVTALVSLTCLPYRFMVLHNWDSTLWACLAIYSGIRLIETRGNARHLGWAAATGSWISLTFLFEQSKGGGLALGLAFGLVAIALLQQKQPFVTKASFAAVLAGAAGPVLLTLAWLRAKGILQLSLSAWVWPLEHYSVANHVPYAYQNWSDATRESLFAGPAVERILSVITVSPLWIIPALPLVSIGLLGYWLVRMRKGTDREKSAYYVLMNASVLGLLVSIVIGRPDIVHFMYLIPVFCVTLAWIFDGRDIPGSLFRKLRPLLRAYLVVSFLFMSVALLLRSVEGLSAAQTARGEIRVTGEDTVVDYIRANAQSGETVLIHPYLPLYHYLTGTSNPGRYEYLQPGLHTAEQVQEMLASIAATKPRFALLELAFTSKIPSSWPNTPLKDIVNDPVSDYVLKHYRTCKVLHSPQEWRFLFMTRKDLPCPL